MNIQDNGWVVEAMGGPFIFAGLVILVSIGLIIYQQHRIQKRRWGTPDSVASPEVIRSILP